jgi:hypothetical protein
MVTKPIFLVFKPLGPIFIHVFVSLTNVYKAYIIILISLLFDVTHFYGTFFSLYYSCRLYLEDEDHVQGEAYINR